MIDGQASGDVTGDGVAEHIAVLSCHFQLAGLPQSVQQVVVYTDRMDYVAAFAGNLTYIEAVERLIGLEAPPRAKYMRVVLAELQRIASHLLWLGTHALDLGAATVFFHTFRDREPLYYLMEWLTGGRLTTSYTRVGGLSFDESLPWAADYDFTLRLLRRGDFAYLRRKLYLFDLGAQRFHSAADPKTQLADECAIVRRHGATDALPRLQRLHARLGDDPELDTILGETIAALTPVPLDTRGVSLLLQLEGDWADALRAYIDEISAPEDVTLVLKPAVGSGQRVVVAAHGNSMRALVKYLDNIPDDEIVGVNIPNGVPLVYEFDADMKPIRHYYLGDAAAIEAKMAAVAAQGKAK